MISTGPAGAQESLPKPMNPPAAEPTAAEPPKTPAATSTDKPSEAPAVPPVPPGPLEPPRLRDGGVPVEAAEFRGTLTGCVETIGHYQASFRVKIISAKPDAASKAAKPESLISAVVLVIQGADKGPDGKWTAKPGHHEWVSALKPGSLVVVPVRYTKAANGFRMTEVPPAPKPCDGTAPAAAGSPAPAPAPTPAAPRKD